MKVGEAETRLKQLEVALESAEVDKQNAKTEAALAKEKAEVLISELKRIESCVSIRQLSFELQNLSSEINMLMLHMLVSCAVDIYGSLVVLHFLSSASSYSFIFFCVLNTTHHSASLVQF